LSLNNIGGLADKYIPGQPLEGSGGKYDSNIVMFSGGFYLSGRSNGFLWANASFGASNVFDYTPGPVGSLPQDPKNIFYVISTSDPPFGSSWQKWKDAVSLGASFYDGNNDGIYNPVDLNGNGKWDSNEDRPDFLGDVSAWCVYNDGVPATQRYFSDVNPQGIEIQQTVFAQKDSADLNNVVFIRYRMINKGTVAEIMDSVFFGSVYDMDIGDSGMLDLAGCDTLLNSVYTYHDKNNVSQKWGPNPPAEFASLLQGPLSYIPGITFTDVNSNGVYDPGIDSPLDSAFSFNGPLLGKSTYPGAKNLIMSSANQYFKNQEPANRFQARYVLTGKDHYSGAYYDPCNFLRGKVFGSINCAAVNPLFLFSGDPLTQTGWIDTLSLDQRSLLSSGPFKLEKNKPVDILIAEIVGRGVDPLNSITVAKGYVSNIIKYYNSNFPNSILTGIKKIPYLVNNFSLNQNYPNPFNPSTIISYSLPKSSYVKLIVYNTLGQTIKLLENSYKQPGNYSVSFNASSLPSGIYFYKLEAGPFSQIRKMILLK
jgi:hypothetical protein